MAKTQQTPSSGAVGSSDTTDSSRRLEAGAGQGGIGGEAIYRQQCASCHGNKGEGTPKFSQSLTGDRTLTDLQKYIDETMPEEVPQKCSGDDAARVAAYIYHAFYSPLAQARNQPPRIAGVPFDRPAVSPIRRRFGRTPQ